MFSVAFKPLKMYLLMTFHFSFPITFCCFLHYSSQAHRTLLLRLFGLVYSSTGKPFLQMRKGFLSHLIQFFCSNVTCNWPILTALFKNHNSFPSDFSIPLFTAVFFSIRLNNIGLRLT